MTRLNIVNSAKVTKVGITTQEGWPHTLYTLTLDGEVFNYRTGLGIKTEPSVTDILDCLLSDSEAGTISFEEFADNLGYSTDSIKALNTYLECSATYKRLTKIFGYGGYAALLIEKQERESA